MDNLDLNPPRVQTENFNAVDGQAQLLQRLTDLPFLTVHGLSLTFNFPGQILHDLGDAGQLLGNKLAAVVYLPLPAHIMLV
ncbi:hypothetical protein D3C80_2035550 [compost metagenome]